MERLQGHSALLALREKTPWKIDSTIRHRQTTLALAPAFVTAAPEEKTLQILYAFLFRFSVWCPFSNAKKERRVTAAAHTATGGSVRDLVTPREQHTAKACDKRHQRAKERQKEGDGNGRKKKNINERQRGRESFGERHNDTSTTHDRHERRGVARASQLRAADNKRRSKERRGTAHKVSQARAERRGQREPRAAHATLHMGAGRDREPQKTRSDRSRDAR